MTHDFHPDARTEYCEAAAWYEERRFGLGEEFIAEVEHGIKCIAKAADTFQRVDDDFRVFRLKRFPYYIYYGLSAGLAHFRIYAIAHNRRRPGYWSGRIKG